MWPTSQVPSVLVGSLAPLGQDGIMSGIVKHITTGPWRITPDGIDDDAQDDRKHNGGPEKALHHYPRERYAAWQSEILLHVTCLRAAGHSKIESTVRYLSVEVDDAIEIAEKIGIQSVDAVSPIPDMVGGARRIADLASRDGSYWDGPANVT